MGRLIITCKDGHLESFKCKSKERAEEIANKRPDKKDWNFYERNERILDIRKKTKNIENFPQSFEELDRMIRRDKLSY